MYNICVMENFPLNHNVDRNVVKIVGLDLDSDIAQTDILEHIAQFINPKKIKCLFYDNFRRFYVLFLTDIEATCRIINRNFQILSKEVIILPFLYFIAIHNVYPSVSKEELKTAFSMFGEVLEVKDRALLPHLPRFSHIISGTKELSFILPKTDSMVGVPDIVHCPPNYKLKVMSICCACMAEGHSIVTCPDNDIDKDTSSETSSNDDELIAIIKKEKVGDSVVESSIAPSVSATSSEKIFPLNKWKRSAENGNNSGNSKRKNKSTVPGAKSQNATYQPLQKLSSEIEECLRKCKGVLPLNILQSLFFIDATDHSNVRDFIQKHTKRMEKVKAQLHDLHRICVDNGVASTDIGKAFLDRICVLVGIL